MAAEQNKVNATCQALARYYKSLDVPYNDIFSTYCDEQEFDDEAVLAELNTDSAAQCILCDFDENFPFHPKQLEDYNKEKKQQFIFDLIGKCHENPNITFVIPEIHLISFDKSFMKTLFDITLNDLNETKNIYKKQCEVIWNSGLSQDQNQLSLLTMGRKHDIDLSQHLVDSFLRKRIENKENKEYKEEEWMKDCIFCKNCKEIPIKRPINTGKNADDIIKHSLQSFYKRCCPKLSLYPMIKINDSIEITIRYIHSAVGFIEMLIKESNHLLSPIFPFQMDFCVGFGEPISLAENFRKYKKKDDNDDDDDDDDDDKKEKNDDDKEEKVDEFVDCIGDIESKLKQNKLKYMKSSIKQIREHDFEYIQARDFLNCFKAFKDKYSFNKKNKSYPHYQRFITFVDRRPTTNPDEAKENIWMYEPPSDSKSDDDDKNGSIPKDAVSEWFLNSSKMCLLPNMEYDPEKAKQDRTDNKEENETREKLLNSNISSSFHCNGALLTLSFHCKSMDEIKSYLYWNGQITRFMPEDIITVLPELFNMKWNDGNPLIHGKKSENEVFIEREEQELNALIKEMRKTLQDKYFKCFQSWTDEQCD